MPIYEYRCEDCDTEVEVILPMSEATDKHECRCGADMHRVFSFHAVSKGRNYSKAIVSDSLAMNPEQIPEHRRLFPDIVVTPDGRPVFDNYKKHDEYLEKINMRKKPQKIRRKSKKATAK